MPDIKLDMKHGRTLDEARGQLRHAVDTARGQFGMMIQRVDWAADGNAVTVVGTGFRVEMRVDAAEVHVAGDLTFLSGLLGGPFGTGLKQIVQQTFRKKLT